MGLTMDVFSYAYECGNLNCPYYRKYKQRFYWFSDEPDLKKITDCPECGEAEKIYRKEGADG